MKKGYVPIDIPTKKYIKAYVIGRLGEQPVMDPRHHIGNKLFSLLRSKKNERKTEFANERYNAKLRIYISRHVLKNQGCNLNESNIKLFNSYLEAYIKGQLYFMLDFYTEILPSFEANLPLVRKHLRIDLEHWEDESIKKDYYRYRKSNGLPLMYNKTSSKGPF